ncbi:MAG: thiamine-phosphate kinase [Nitrospirae bacterium]|nr:thiamine-phosphate kinase [Nitrospirota bacterium]
MSSSQEDRLLQWLRGELRKDGSDRIGDDAALLPKAETAITVDHQIAGVHFPTGLDPRVVARRLLAVNLSDLAAMGADPRYAFLALSSPPDQNVKSFLRALLKACRRANVELAGGDLARSPVLSATLTLVGGKPPRGRWVRRSNGQPGDRLWLGGPVGQSALGRHLLASGAEYQNSRIQLPPDLASDRCLATAARQAIRRHLFPHPQIDLGLWLGRRRRAAAIDISDGLSLDLHRLCRESGVGARLDVEKLPTSRSFLDLCARLHLKPLDLMLSGGEDYCLLFSLPASIRPPDSYGCSRIGELTRDRSIRRIEGEREGLLEARGWDHLEARS